MKKRQTSGAGVVDHNRHKPIGRRPGPTRSGEPAPSMRILNAARKLFFTEGFADISIERLAREAQVSKSTLYKYFGDMTGVLRAVAEAEADDAAFGGFEVSDDPNIFTDQLIQMGADLLTLIEQPDKLRFDRLVLEQARSHPDLAETYWKAIYARTQGQLADVLQAAQGKGYMRTDLAADVLADQLLSMWQGLAAARLRLSLSPLAGRSPHERSRDAVTTLVRAASPTI